MAPQAIPIVISAQPRDEKNSTKPATLSNSDESSIRQKASPAKSSKAVTTLIAAPASSSDIDHPEPSTHTRGRRNRRTAARVETSSSKVCDGGQQRHSPSKTNEFHAPRRHNRFRQRYPSAKNQQPEKSSGFWDYAVSNNNHTIQEIQSKSAPICIPAPNPEDPELKKDLDRVRLLFNNLSPASPDTPDTQSKDADTTCFRITINSTDPSFDVDGLLPTGLELRLSFNYFIRSEAAAPAAAPANNLTEADAQSMIIDSATSSAITSTPYALNLTVCVMNLELPNVFTDAVTAIAAQSWKETASAYSVLKMLQRSISEIFEYTVKVDPASLLLYRRSLGPQEWTPEEQLKLEDGIVWYGKVVDQKEKWNLIAKLVGNQRTARECVDRFRVCRMAVLQKKEEKNIQECSGVVQSVQADINYPAIMHKEDLSEKVSDDQPQSEQNLDNDNRHENEQKFHQRLCLKNLQLQGVSLLHLSTGRAVTACSKCHTQCEMTLKIPSHVEEDGEGIEAVRLARVSTVPISQSLICKKCSSKMSLSLSLSPAFATSGEFASYKTEGCDLIDVLPPQFLVECAECGAVMLCRDIFTGTTRSLICRSCHQTLAISFDAVDFGSVAAGSSAGILANVRINQALKRVKDTHQFKIGTALPAEGTCKHYKKSFRWLRFPCCGRAFPCDVCHDEVSDHPHEWASRMICGRCSKEQPYSQKPCICGASTTSSFSSHWEGGRGCRDPIRMSRKDDKKFKLIRSKATKPS